MIRQIVLIDSKRGIAKQGDQPVHLPADSAYFRDITSQAPANVLFGRATYAVIGLLPHRQNFILTHDTKPIAGAHIVNDLGDFLANFQEDLWIAGGAAVYAATLGAADELYVTEMTTDLGCDQFYPEYLPAFELVSRSKPISEQGIEYTFCIYRRKTAASAN